MRNIRQLCIAAFLTLTLAFPVFAGEIHLPGVTAPDETQSETVAGDILTPGATDDSAIEVALGFLLDVSSLL